VLQAAVAQSAQLAVPLAWELAAMRGAPQAVPHAEQDDQQAAQSVPCASLVAQLGVSLGDLLAVHLEPAYSSVVHWALPLAAHSDACDPLDGPRADCLAAHLAGDHWQRAAAS
jgi:hypothetical protein